MNRTKLLTTLALAPLCIGSACAEAFHLQRIRGDIAPGTDGKSYLDFSESVINDSLQFAYRGRLGQGGGVNLTNNDGAWSDDGCIAKLLARERDDAPGTSVQFAMSIDASSFQLNDADVVAFRSTLQGSGVSAANDLAVFQCLPGSTPTLVAREGDVDTVTANTFLFVGRPALTSSATGDLFHRVDFVRSGPVTAANDTAMFGFIGGAHTLIAREGDPTPTLKLGGVGTFGQILSEAYTSDSGYLLFAANILGVGQANIGLFLRDPGGTLTSIYQKLEAAPDATGAATAQVLGTFRDLGVNDSGEVIVRGTLLINTGGVTSANDEVILTDAGGTFRRIAQEGSLDPAGNTYGRFQTVFIGNSGITAYGGQTIDGGLRNGIYGTPAAGSPPVLIARESDAALGTPSTHLRLDRPVVNHAGHIAYTSRLALSGGITGTSDSILSLTTTAGTPPAAPLAQEGDFENDAQGTILAFDLNEPNTPNGGVASSGRALNDSDNMIINLTTIGAGGTREGVYTFEDRAPVFCDEVPDIAFNVPVGSGSVPAFWTPPTAIDDLDGPLIPVGSHTPGDFFAIGVTIVNYTATDSTGNISTSRFRVIITEIRDPGKMLTLDRLVNEGDPADSAAGNYRSFTEVTVNSNSDVAFTASTSAGAAGIWSNGHGAAGGVPGLVSLQGDVNDAGAEYRAYSRLALSDVGDVAFQSLLQGIGLTGINNESVDLEFSMAMTPPVRESHAATDATGAATARVFRQFYRPAISTDSADANTFTRANLLVGTGGVTSKEDTGVWQRAAGGTMLLERAVEGATIPDGSGLTYGQINARVTGAATESYVFSALLKGTGVRNTNDSAVFLGEGATITRLVREGTNAPCSAESASQPVKNTRSNNGRFGAFFAESINDTGTVVAIRAAMKKEGLIDASSDGGIWTIDIGVAVDPISPIAIEGHQAPGFVQGVQFDRFDDVAVTPAGDVWFTAYLRHDAILGIDSSNDFGVWTSSDGYLRPMAQEGQTAPNTDGGLVRRISGFAYENGAVAATIALDIGTGDATTTNETCLLSGFDLLTGLFQINVREGDVFDFAPADPRIISSFRLREIFNANGGSGGYGNPVTGGGVDSLAFPMKFNGNGNSVVLRDVAEVGP